MLRRATAFTLMFLFASALNLAAADGAATAKTQATGTLGSEAIARAARDAEPSIDLWTLSQKPRRPALLPALYGTYAVLQGMDLVSTRKALSAGAREGNPVMGSGNLGTTIALKAATGAATVYFVEKTWKKHRVGAIVLMAAINGASAAVVAHNNRNASQGR
jgi:hypothetical protein